MAIKAVDSIPRVRNTKMTFTQMALNDIKEAFDSRIEQFEFDGDYNYKTLAPIARQQASRYFSTQIYVPTVRKVKIALAEEGYTEIDVPSEREFRYGANIIHIFGVTCEDRVHVYGKIYLNTLDNFYDDILIRSREISKKKIL